MHATQIYNNSECTKDANRTEPSKYVNFKIVAITQTGSRLYLSIYHFQQLKINCF